MFLSWQSDLQLVVSTRSPRGVAQGGPMKAPRVDSLSDGDMVHYTTTYITRGAGREESPVDPAFFRVCAHHYQR